MGVSIALLFLILVAVLGWRVGSLVAFMVPLTIFSTMAVLLLLGFSMNRIVIAALVISAGIVLDNHIVVAQYLSRKLHEGVDRNVAMQETFRLMAPPMLVATLTSIIGFFPVLFADHLAAEYVADIVPVIGIALGFSYLFAFTATPIFTPATPAATSPIQSLEKWGRSIISRVVAQPRTALGITVVISVAGLVLLAARPSDFFPANNRTLVAIETILPVGASQESTRKAMARTSQTVEKVLQETQLVEAVTSVSFRGSSVPRFSPNMPQSIPSPNKGTMLLSFPHRRAMDAFRQKTGEILSADPLEMTRIYPVIAGPQIGWPVEIRITGPEALLEKVAPQLADTLAAMPELANPHCSSTSTVTRWKLTPKREQAAEKGVTPADIALAMSVSLNGLHSFDLGSGDQAVPVFVQPKQTKKDPAENMEDAYVYPEKGMPCLMDEVAEVESVKGPAAIERYRGVPAITFVADCAPGFTPYEAEQLAIARIKQILGSTPELVVTSVGLSKTAQEAKAALMKGVPWALIAVFLVILIQTHSFRLSLLAVGAIPFGMAGAGFGLLFFGMPIGFMSLIGLTAMAGLVVNFSVVMLASVKAHQGVSAVDDSGIIDGTVERIEPILLSVLSASCGMGVLYVFGGELWRSMAITMVSGLLLASVLVIVAVPASSKIFLCRNNRTP